MTEKAVVLLQQDVWFIWQKQWNF